jgi:hypothetical protein
MKTVRLFHRVALAALAVFVLTRPAAAQDETEADTIWVDGDKTIVIMGDEGRRMIIRSGDEDGARVFFDNDDDGFFRVAPGGFGYRFGQPNVLEFEEGRWQSGDAEDNVAVLGDYLENMSGVWGGRLGDEIRFGFGASMKERSEIAQMEMESRRLAQRARRAEGEERARLETELEEQLQDIFDRKQAMREEQIDRLREELDKALDAHNERSGHQSEIIERRMRQLLGREDKYDW